MKIHLLASALCLLTIPALPDAPSQDNRIIVAAGDSGVSLALPSTASQQLLKGNNSTGDDLQVQLIHERADEVGDILWSYRIVVTKSSTGEPVSPFAFSSPVLLQMGYWTVFGRNPTSPGTTWTGIEKVQTVLGAFWNNGSGYIRVHDLTTNPDQSVSLTIHNTGSYQIRAVQEPSTFHLASGSPYPRVITPTASKNRRVFFFFENPTEENVTGSIYDFQGAKVRGLQINAQSPTANCLVWDGRDDGGQLVPAGPYLYKVSTGDNSVSGGLVVAR